MALTISTGRSPVIRTRLLIYAVFTITMSAYSQDSPTTHVPSWAKQAVWYQIFPERFRNGDTANDPTIDDLRGSWPHEPPVEWHISPWSSDWYEAQSWERRGGEEFYRFVQRRRYGGDLQGVIDKLDYLADLGINAIYLNPIFESPSLHKYDATLYHHIDNNFGPTPAQDRLQWAAENFADPATWQWTGADTLFLRLIREAHRRGMKVIIDGVFNHVGQTFWAFEDVRKNQQNSAYKEWFTIKRWDDPATPENEFDYQGWFNVRELPELREDENGIVHGPREHIHAVVRRWMDPNGDGNPSDGIDGWRLDVADMVSLNFWKEFRQWVRAINPEAYITGEVWWEDWGKNKIYNAERWLRGDAFDAVMNYRWAREVCHYFIDKKEKIPVSEFLRRLDSLRADYRGEVNFALMNLLDSHDTDRLLSRIVNPDMAYDHNVGLHDNPAYDPRKPTLAEINTQKLIALFQMTCLGAPMIYYGDEAGMWGGDDPDERKPMLWADMHYANERSHPFGKARPDDVNAFDAGIYSSYQKLIRLRSQHPALQYGTMETLVADDGNDVFAFARTAEPEQLVVVVNNAPVPQKVTVPATTLAASQEWVDLISGAPVDRDAAGLHLMLPAKSGTVVGSVVRK